MGSLVPICLGCCAGFIWAPHYRVELTLRYLPLRYEDMVDRQQTTVRGMLEFIGVDYDERCLRFHENRRYAHTVSQAQVTEGLYDRSRFRN